MLTKNRLHCSLHSGDTRILRILQCDLSRAYPNVNTIINLKFLNQSASSLDILKQTKLQPSTLAL